MLFACLYQSGTTWVQSIVAHLLCESDTSPMTSFAHVTDIAPFFERDEYWTDADKKMDSNCSDEMLAPDVRAKFAKSGRRCFNTHLRWEDLPKGSNGGAWPRYIYVFRDGRDSLTSFYHHLSSCSIQDGGYEGSFDNFFDDFCENRLVYGRWHEHLISYSEAIYGSGSDGEASNNILVLCYEEMLSESGRREAVMKIAKHIRYFLFYDFRFPIHSGLYN